MLTLKDAVLVNVFDTPLSSCGSGRVVLPLGAAGGRERMKSLRDCGSASLACSRPPAGVEEVTVLPLTRTHATLLFTWVLVHVKVPQAVVKLANCTTDLPMEVREECTSCGKG